MVRVRPAEDRDVERIREVFLAAYGDDYAYPEFCDLGGLRRLVHDDGTLLLVAEREEDGLVVGTASVVMHVGAYADLVGEFGRLVVHPDFRGHGIGKKLMEGRIAAIERRLHVGIVENRCVHTFSQRISHDFGFAPVGFCPGKLRIAERESVAVYVRHFGQALELRRNNPRIVPEVHALAATALGNCGLPVDTIVEDETGYVHDVNFDVCEMTTEGYASLLRIERGRVKHREIFGPMRLHYGLFQLEARHSTYLVARESGRIVGAIGFTRDEVERAVKVFELIAIEDGCVHQLFSELLRRCREEWRIEYVDTDVSAHAPRMQRTLLDLEFVPTAYIPAMVFHDVERFDAVRMSRLLVPFDPSKLEIFESSRSLVDVVLDRLVHREIPAELARAVPHARLFRGCSEEQVRALAAICRLEEFRAGDVLLRPGEPHDSALLILAGRVDIAADDVCTPVGTVAAGECLGETALVETVEHVVTATAIDDVSAVRIERADLARLLRTRPDIGVLVYRNLAVGLAEKLRRSSRRLAADADAS